MQILHAGNMANVGYVITKTLRNSGIDADLLMEKYPVMTSDPRSVDPELMSKGFPEWIKFWDNSKQTSNQHSIQWKLDILKQMRSDKYELIHAHVELPIFAMLSMKPYIAHSHGSDLTELAFQRSIKAKLLRHAYKKAKLVISSTPHQFPLIAKLKIKNALLIPTPWNYENFVPKQVDRSEYGSKFLIFHATAQDWRLKGNDSFLQAFVRLCKEREDVMLIIIERGVDLQRAHEFLQSERTANKVKFIKGPLKQFELLYYYNLADIVVDQFVIGSVGTTAMEALSCGKPVIAFIYNEFYEKLYGEAPPIINSKDEHSIYNALVRLIDSRDLCKQIGLKSREWMLKHLDTQKIAKKYVQIYTAISNGEDVDRIRELVTGSNN